MSSAPMIDQTISLTDEIRAAVTRQDYHGAESLWERFTTLHPNLPQGYVGLADIWCRLDQRARAEDFLAEALTRFRSDQGILRSYARLAQDRKDWRVAYERWTRFSELYPDDLYGIVGRATAARASGKNAEGIAILSQARAAHPANKAVEIAFARAMEAIRDTTQTLTSWQNVVALFASDPVGHLGLIAAYRRVMDYSNAELALEPALKLFPKDERFWSHAIEIALSLRSGELALARSLAALEAVPGSSLAVIGKARALDRLGKRQDADDVLLAAAAAHPNEIKFLHWFALLARGRAHWAAAEQRWIGVRDKFPERPEGYNGIGESLRCQKRFDDADAAMAVALQKFAENVQTRLCYALIAHERCDWPEAKRRWALVREIAPDNGELRKRYGDVELFMSSEALSFNSASGTVSDRPASVVDDAEPSAGPDDSRQAALKKFFMSFEGLGWNCEFGLVQRMYHAEPLGLLRFIEIPAESMAIALEKRFEGVGDRENTTIYMSHGEYQTKDTRYVMTTHTCVREIQPDVEKFLQSYCRRTRYLRDKLIADLEAAEKIFVYQRQDLTDDEIQRIHRAVRTYGSSVLLCVRKTTSAATDGEVENRGDGLFVASRARGGRDTGEWNLNLDEWLSICLTTARMSGVVPLPVLSTNSSESAR